MRFRIGWSGRMGEQTGISRSLSESSTVSVLGSCGEVVGATSGVDAALETSAVVEEVDVRGVLSGDAA